MTTIMVRKIMLSKMMMEMKSSDNGDDYGDEGDDHNYVCIERLYLSLS